MNFDLIDKLVSMPKRDSLAPGLKNVQSAARRLNLHELACPLLTVAGTNGKGSSVAFLEYCYYEAGYRVGSYTSPHIHHFNERIKINCQPIDNDILNKAYSELETIVSTCQLSFFEVTTLLAFYCFQNEALEVIIAEIGLGGRLDAVNAWDADIALITSIDLDHQHYLGDTRELIAIEKAGIMRNGRPVVCADPHPPHTILTEAKRIGAELYTCEPIEEKALIGASNAAGVLKVLDLLQPRLPVSKTIIARALQEVNPPGRLQHLDKGCDWVVDVSHNPASMRRLADHLRSLNPATKTYAIIGMCDDKDIEGSLRNLGEFVDEWHVAAFANPRSATGVKLAQSVKAFSNKPCYNHESIALAVQTVQQKQHRMDRVIVCGSFHTVAEL